MQPSEKQREQGVIGSNHDYDGRGPHEGYPDVCDSPPFATLGPKRTHHQVTLLEHDVDAALVCFP